MDDLTKKQKLLLLAAMAGPYRVPAGKVRVITGVGTQGVRIASNQSVHPLFIRIALAGSPAAGANFVFSTQNAGAKDTASTQAVWLEDYTTAVVNPGQMRFYDCILLEGEDLYVSCIDAIVSLKATEVTVV